MPEYTDYFDPFAVEVELPLRYEYDPSTETRDDLDTRQFRPMLNPISEARFVDADTRRDIDQQEGN